jgi:predicted nucleic acid-binding protein
MIVVDASAVAKLALDESESDLVRELWGEAEVTAPTVILPEIAAAVARAGRDNRLVGADALEVANALTNYVELSAITVDLAMRAAGIAAVTGVRGMDAIYLATALEITDHGIDVALLSFDSRQREAALDLGIAIIPAEVPDR